MVMLIFIFPNFQGEVSLPWKTYLHHTIKFMIVQISSNGSSAFLTVLNLPVRSFLSIVWGTNLLYSCSKVNEMAELKGNKRRNALIIASFILLGVVIIAVFGYQGIVNPEQLEIRTTQPAEARQTDAAADSWEEPPTATTPPTNVRSTESTVTATETPTNMPTNPGMQGTLKFTPELFIYHTP